MEVYYQLVTNAADLKAVCAEMSGLQTIGLDCETTALDPYNGELRLVQLAASPTSVKVIDLRVFPEPKTNPDLDCLRELLFAQRPTKVLHNAKFDAKWLRLHVGAEVVGIFDTYLASQILAAGEMERRHSLADVSYDFLGEELDKSQQLSDWNAAELSASQIEYAARDAAIVLRVREKMIERLKSDALIDVAKLEFDCVVPIAELELAGIFVDKERWREQLKKVKGEQIGIADELQEMLSVGALQGSLFGRTEINLDSHTQLNEALLRLGVPMPATTRGWQLEPLAADYPVIKKLLEYRGVAKAISSYGENFLEFINPKTGRIHADFRQIGAPTGRMSCVAEGTLVDVPGGRVPIEQIKPGDFVYCYAESGKPTVRKVLNVWDNGVQDCVEIKWQSSGDNSVGNLVVTPDHKIKTKHNAWQPAGELKRGDKLFHLRRSLVKRVDKSVRVRLYGTNSYMELEEHLLKREFFKAESSLHIHHKNENPGDNRIENLQILSGAEHIKLHLADEKRIAQVRLNLEKAWQNPATPKFGAENHLWKTVSRFQLLKMLARAKGRTTLIAMDFDTFKRKCQLEQIEIKTVQARYGANGIYLSDKNILAALATNRNAEEASRSLGIGTRKLKAICARHGIAYNHQVLSVKPVGARRVFDLEVEETHNFIAGEICVHNCNNPNIQQVPHGDAYRRCFRAPEGRKFVIADYSQIELRILADFTDDPGFVSAFQSGADLHRDTASRIFNTAPENVTGDQRSFAKRINFGVVYGIGAQRVSSLTGISLNEAQELLRKYFQTYRKLDGWLREAAARATRERQARTVSGRLARFRFDHEDRQAISLAERNGKNTPIQGSSADIFKRALRLLHEELRDTTACVVNTIHDEIVVECDANDAEMIVQKVEKGMCEAGEEYVKKVPIKVESVISDEWLK